MHATAQKALCAKGFLDYMHTFAHGRMATRLIRSPMLCPVELRALLSHSFNQFDELA